ncbi:ImmA/IrrE family metallo-endopeptidase [Anabaena lutea]|uniref:ImmA/IrrE family metallo-endopeptidase n=1 Tax=Anabaena lutea FACHB-196 TaxID=2692881 RepID=A0ABR8FGY9_9NOST|nr:ImmA/IrrE family metallo-endopeptidase [Anabaena lutea]MBD2569495.1 ImmA/IrrE family metallo-endopeptidase [Anabaena lutea FACHB-196]
MTELTRPFTPDWISPPGDTIADLLEERQWTQEQLAEDLKCTNEYISQLITGQESIDDKIAFKLEQVLGGTAKFWLNRESDYRSELVRLQQEEKKLQKWTDWLEKLPVRELMNRGAITKYRIDATNKPSLVRELLYFFDVSSPEEWLNNSETMEVAFRRTRQEKSDLGAISAWIRLGEIEAEEIDCPEYSEEKFKNAVQEIRKLTILSPQDFTHQIQQLCQEAGVVLILVPSIPRAHISGMVRWLNPNKALIQISDYGKRNDRFWFTFFHEAAHILLHNKQDIFLDEFDGEQIVESEQERQANEWAREFLIPNQYSNELDQLKSKESVINFSKRLGIHPGIVVGRLQNDGLIERNQMNDLKTSFSIDDLKKLGLTQDVTENLIPV